MKPAEFELLTRPKQRVVIAKDVIAQIRAKKYIPRVGDYIDEYYLKSSKDLSIQKNFSHIKNCSVCALGGCMLSIVKYKNQLTFGDLEEGFYWNGEKTQDKSVYKMLSKFFSTKQLALIECAFEGNSNENAFTEGFYTLTEELLQKCFTFYNKYPEDKDRLVAIMKNIIENTEFKP